MGNHIYSTCSSPFFIRTLWKAGTVAYSNLWLNLLYCAARFANFEGILGFSILSIILADLLGNTCLLVIGAFWCTLFVSVLQGSLLVMVLFRTLSGNDRLSFFEAFYDRSFLFLSLARIKQWSLCTSTTWRKLIGMLVKRNSKGQTPIPKIKRNNRADPNKAEIASI